MDHIQGDAVSKIGPKKDKKEKTLTPKSLYPASSFCELLDQFNQDFSEFLDQFDQALTAEDVGFMPGGSVDREELLINVVPSPVFYKNREGVYLGCNRAFEEFVGKPSTEIAGKTVYDITPEEMADKYRAKDEELFQNPGQQTYEWTITTSSGEVRNVIFNKATFQDATGRVAGLVGVISDITDQKQTEDRLKESEERFRELAEMLPETIYEMDLRGNITYANQKAYKQFGYTRKDVESGLNAYDMILPEHRQRALNNVKDIVNGKDTGLSEYTALRKDGSTFDALFGTTAIRREGTVVGLRGFIIDITERKEIEEQLYEQRSQYSALFHGITDAVFVHHIADDGGPGRIIDVNEAACNLLGYCKEELIDRDIADIDIPESVVVAHKIVEKLKAGQNVLFEQIHMAKDGKRIPVEVHSRTFHYKGGLAILSTVRDITGRKQAEKAIRESQQLLEQTFSSLKDAIFVIDLPKRKILNCNSAACEIFGYDRNEMVGRKPDFLHVDKDSADLFKAEVRRATEGEGHLSVPEFKMKCKDGTVIFTEHSVSSLRDDRGDCIGWVSLIRDISKRKELQRRLQQAQKMEAIGTLAGGIAHDFNNILTPVMMQAELALLEAAEGNPTRANLQEILEAGYRAKSLVKQILAFSRETENKRESLSITPIVKECLKLLRSTLPSTITIETHIDSEPGNVLADPTQVYQLLMNLCTNAAHAMRGQNGVLTVNVRETDITRENARRDLDLGPGKYVKLSVSDTGHGIDPHVRERIFEPYFTTKDRGEGTGLGLSTVHGIVTNYGGAVSFESEVGRGSTFAVYLPSIQRQIPSTSPREIDLPGGNERILVVDDEDPMVKALGSTLKKLGYFVFATTSSMEALEEIKSNTVEYDLMITDQTMPNMTGIELARAALKESENLPIILCTGFSDQVDEEKAKQVGITKYLLKPILMKDMAHAIRAALDD
jgi:PAS domain S-box-containing protein